jgi:toxin ParE1/3/4
MANVVRTPDAIQDLREIVGYISRDSTRAATRWLDGIEDLFQLLASQPGMGECWRARHGGEVRRHAYGSYIVYFRALDHGVQIIRVLHGARDQGRLI